MLQNAYFLAKIGADTAENEQQFAEILPIGRRAPARTTVGRGRGQPRPRGPLVAKWPRRISLQKSAAIQPKTSKFYQTIANNLSFR